MRDLLPDGTSREDTDATDEFKMARIEPSGMFVP
jgi:hypothetical protein